MVTWSTEHGDPLSLIGSVLPGSETADPLLDFVSAKLSERSRDPLELCAARICSRIGVKCDSLSRLRSVLPSRSKERIVPGLETGVKDLPSS